jgi:hypothetical protein
MKRFILLSVIIIQSFLFFSCTNQPRFELTETQKEGLRSDSKEFMESLKSVLIKEIQTKGILAAVSVCSDTAQILSNNFGITKGIYIKRISFKNRNPNNSPDEFEVKALKYFEELKSKEKLNDTSEFVEIVEKDGVKNIRYLKAIIIQAPCLNCHGQEEYILPDVRAVINQKYPDDKAIGYEIDDFRGAVSITKTL